MTKKKYVELMLEDVKQYGIEDVTNILHTWLSQRELLEVIAKQKCKCVGFPESGPCFHEQARAMVAE